MARTRSAKGAASQDSAATAKPSNNASSIYTLPAELGNPPKLFILPKNTTPEARIVTLQNPRYGKPTRYLVCPEAGFFEFTKIAPPARSPRSWLLSSSPSNSDNDAAAANLSPYTPTEIVQSPALYLATPFDPFFLLLPALAAAAAAAAAADGTTSATKKRRMFTSLDAHLDLLPDPSRHLAEMLSQCPATQALVAGRLAAACDTVEAAGETMYRFSEDRALREVLVKARRMAEGGGLPRSMEERFVRRVLEAPVAGVKVVRGQGGKSIGDADGVAAEEDEAAAAESQGSCLSTGESSSAEAETGTSSGSEVSGAGASTAATSIADEDPGAADGVVSSAMVAPSEVVELQRLRVAFDFICSSYVAPPAAEMLRERLDKAATDLVDFGPLDEYLARLAKLRQDAAAARSADYSRKRAAEEEEEDERAEKRRKKAAEEKAKKANQSRGVKELMKVNTSGMKKLSEFFKKK